MIRHPLVTFCEDPEGTFLVESCPMPDRLAATEFYAGLLVADFPADYLRAFERLRASGESLTATLPQTVVEGGIWVVISGLDYATLRPGPQSRIQAL